MKFKNVFEDEEHEHFASMPKPFLHHQVHTVMTGAGFKTIGKNEWRHPEAIHPHHELRKLGFGSGKFKAHYTGHWMGSVTHPNGARLEFDDDHVTIKGIEE